MKFNSKTTLDIMRRQFRRWAWTTTHQKWTTSFAIGGLVVATLLVPPVGIAVFGTAFAGWWLTVFIVASFSGLIGSRLGIGREKATLLRQAERGDIRD
jgi:hypothetical protein